jgi:hypothetical protein
VSEATQLTDIKWMDWKTHILFGTINWIASLVARNNGFSLRSPEQPLNIGKL